MGKAKINVFEIVLLIVGVTAGFLGFKLINQVYAIDGTLSWLMIIAIFTWLMLLVLFISLSVVVDVSKKQLTQLKIIAEDILSKKGKK